MVAQSQSAAILLMCKDLVEGELIVTKIRPTQVTQPPAEARRQSLSATRNTYRDINAVARPSRCQFGRGRNQVRI